MVPDRFRYLIVWLRVPITLYIQLYVLAGLWLSSRVDVVTSCDVSAVACARLRLTARPVCKCMRCTMAHGMILSRPAFFSDRIVQGPL